MEKGTSTNSCHSISIHDKGKLPTCGKILLLNKYMLTKINYEYILSFITANDEMTRYYIFKLT